MSDPHAFILEYLCGGDLLGFLRKSRGHGDVYYSGECYPTSSLTERDLLSFAWMTADGMAYLAKNEVRKTVIVCVAIVHDGFHNYEYT